MIRLGARTNLAAFRNGLSDAHRKQVPYALALAVTDMAQRAKVDVQASMKATFNHPNSYTLGAVFATKATKANPRAIVGLKDQAGSGSTPAWMYLAPEIDGGERRRKRFEIALGLPGYIVPGPGAQLDGSGNISRAQLGAILSALGQNGSALRPATQAKLAGRKVGRVPKGASSPYYLQRKAGRPQAIYKELGGGDSVPVLFFTQQAPEYSKRWDLGAVVLSSLEHSRKDAFASAWARAVASAKP